MAVTATGTEGDTRVPTRTYLTGTIDSVAVKVKRPAGRVRARREWRDSQPDRGESPLENEKLAWRTAVWPRSTLAIISPALSLFRRRSRFFFPRSIDHLTSRTRRTSPSLSSEVDDELRLGSIIALVVRLKTYLMDLIEK